MRSEVMSWGAAGEKPWVIICVADDGITSAVGSQVQDDPVERRWQVQRFPSERELDAAFRGFYDLAGGEPADPCERLGIEQNEQAAARSAVSMVVSCSSRWAKAHR